MFFFVSGGVDSTVACALCQRALGPERVQGVYVDTGLMREGETESMRRMPGVAVESAEAQFLDALAGVRDPEKKRHIIGEEFVRVQERIVESRHLMDGRWILGQGTIYPDTIESGGTEKAAVIKTHHNRVPGIQRLIDAGCIVEPLRSYYKDEVREIGRELDLPGELLDRHPFPGPGLAIRCLCSEVDAGLEATQRRLRGAGAFGRRARRQPQLRARIVRRGTGSDARHGTDQSHIRRKPCDRARAHDRAVSGNAGMHERANG